MLHCGTSPRFPYLKASSRLGTGGLSLNIQLKPKASILHLRRDSSNLGALPLARNGAVFCGKAMGCYLGNLEDVWRVTEAWGDAASVWYRS